ncbi:hypothetical protein ACN4DW_04390 [Corynebacterium macclintockiae]|uniref:hypothetical protein n=1 Tax=Corynebacterium macclintockiae TaxID=2913501 RepID=UPI003EB722CA
MTSNVDWLQEVFTNQLVGLDIQEHFNGKSFDQVSSEVSVADKEVRKFFIPTRDARTIDNLLYNTPVTAAEATMPLASLIAAFQADDSAPLFAADSWESAAKALKTSMDDLKSASSGLASSSEGFSFDMARQAIDDVHKTGVVVAANTTAMAKSVRQFPVIRGSNLNALEAIQATTSLIPDPADRLLAEQAAVSNYVSTHLQPSLELVRPPVSNLGVPIVGHTGGGGLDASTVSTASAQPKVSQINGQTNAVTPASATAHGEQAATAAANAPKPTAATAPTQPAGVPGTLHSPSPAPQPIQPAVATAAPHAPAVSPNAPAVPPTTVTTAAPAQGLAASPHSNAGATTPGTLINAQDRFGRANAFNGGAGFGGAGTGAGYGSGAGAGAQARGGAQQGTLRNISSTAPRPSLPGSLNSQNVRPLPVDSPPAKAPQSGKGVVGAPHNSGSAKGGAGMRGGGSAASTMMGRGAAGGRAGNGAKSGLRGGAVTYSKQDRSYFRRLFLSGEDPLVSGKGKNRGRKKHEETAGQAARQTVRKVIR